MSDTFKLSEERINDTTRLIAVDGDLDLFTTPQFKQHASEAIEQGANGLIVDLSAAGMLDSTALGALVSTLQRLREVETSTHPLVIIATAPMITRTLEITGLESIFPVVEDREQALDALD